MARTESLLSLLGIALLTLAACASEDSRSSSNDEGDGGDATTTTASNGSVTSSATGTGGDGGSNTGGAGAGGGGGGGGGGSGGSGGAGGGGAGGESGDGIGMPTLGSWQGGMNCMPIVASDPVSGSFNIVYDNTQGTSEGFVMLSKVSLLLEKNGMNLLWPFNVTPPSSGPVPAGKSVDITHKKVTGSGAGTGSPCDFCGGSWTLFVTAEVGSDGYALSTGPTPVLCVY